MTSVINKTPIVVGTRAPYAKPEGFKGRGKGTTNYKKNKWEIVFFDKDINEMKQGKFSTIKQLNEEMGLALTNDLVWRLVTLRRVDTNKRNKDNSFLSRYGHIKLTKIDEPKNL
jgi:hypothetical protein